MCANAFGERTAKRGPPPLVEGSCVPSQKSTEKGRSGRARASSSRIGSVLESRRLNLSQSLKFAQGGQ
jgi:hypothetical protein